MSAFMVGKPHIDAMVAIAVRWLDQALGPNGLDPDEIGKRLIAENRASINFRYPDTIGAPDREPGPLPPMPPADAYQYAAPLREWTPVEVLVLADCYAYQACEHPGWESSWAFRLCERMRAEAARRASSSVAWMRNSPAYDAAGWEVR